MKQIQTLETYLQQQIADDDTRSAVATTILRIAAAATRIKKLVARGQLDAARGDNTHGDVQEELGRIANERIVEALQNAPVATLVSEELAQPMLLHEAAPLSLAIDPLDGSSNVRINSTAGTIFRSFLQAVPGTRRVMMTCYKPVTTNSPLVTASTDRKLHWC